jgi:hypothetical protein
MPLLEIWGGPHGPPPGFRPAFPDIRRKPGESAKTTQERRLSSRSSKERGAAPPIPKSESVENRPRRWNRRDPQYPRLTVPTSSTSCMLQRRILKLGPMRFGFMSSSAQRRFSMC